MEAASLMLTGKKQRKGEPFYWGKERFWLQQPTLENTSDLSAIWIVIVLLKLNICTLWEAQKRLENTLSPDKRVVESCPLEFALTKLARSTFHSGVVKTGKHQALQNFKLHFSKLIKVVLFKDKQLNSGGSFGPFMFPPLQLFLEIY